MTPLRAYVYYRDPGGVWSVEVARDLESLREVWSQKPQPASIVIHVGFWRPESTAFSDVVEKNPGRVLLTSSAKFVLAKVGSSSALPAGHAGSEAVYIALTGWGYELLDPNIAEEPLAAEVSRLPLDVAAQFEAPRSNWLGAFRRHYPTEASRLDAAAIIDDETFRLNCGVLPSSTHVRAEAYRFDFFVRHSPSRTLSAAAFAAPGWLQQVSVSDLGVSTRTQIVFKELGVTRVGDLIGIDDCLLLRLSNFGRKSLHSTFSAIRDAMTSIPPGQGACGVAPSTRAIGAMQNELQTREEHARYSPDDSNVERTSFRTTIEHLISTARGQTALVVRKRMGFQCQRLTLQQVAQELGVTRERVRQIEAKAVKKFAGAAEWATRFRQRVANAVDGRETPLPIEGLVVIDPWFEGAAENADAFEYVLDKFLRGEFSVLEIDNLRAVTRLSAEEWIEALNAATALIEGNVNSCWRESDVRRALFGLLVGKGEDLRHELFRCATKHAVFVNDSTGDPVLRAFGRGAEALVSAALEESDHPLHYTEIAERVRERFLRNIDARRAQNAAAEVAHLFGRGIYGLRKHLPFTNEELETIVAEAEDIVDCGPEGRQWHAGELSEAICERGLADPDRLNHYGLTLALRQSKALKYLGRFTWAKSSDLKIGTADRIEIGQAAEALLVSEGRPMTRGEIRERLRIDRGLGKTFQLHESGRLVRTGPSTWGLVDRDVSLSTNGVRAALDIIRSEALRANKGVHLTEAIALLKRKANVDPGVLNETLVASLAARSRILNVSSAGYLHPIEWDGPKRLSPIQAVMSVLQEAGPQGLVADDIVGSVAAKLGRDVPAAYVRSLLAVNANWNPQTQRWSADSSEIDLLSDAA